MSEKQQDPHELFRFNFPHPDNFGRLIGYKPVDMTSTPGRAMVKLETEEHHLSPSGAVHGGVLSAFADFTMGAAVFNLLEKGQLCSTIEFKINYLAPVHQGDEIQGVGVVIHHGRSHAIIEAELHVGTRPIAKALGTYNLYYPRNKEHPEDQE